MKISRRKFLRGLALVPVIPIAAVLPKLPEAHQIGVDLGTWEGFTIVEWKKGTGKTANIMTATEVIERQKEMAARLARAHDEIIFKAFFE